MAIAIDVDLETTEAPEESARHAGLRYITDRRPGIHRRRAGKHFSYTGVDGSPIRDKTVLTRIKSLAIPPAWTDVWISPLANGHLQATGRDQRGRKQYRYHPRWREVRDETKFHRMVIFGETLPRIRGQVEEHLSERGLTRERVLATVVRLLDETAIRVGNEEYARENNSFGLTTLRQEHVDVEGSVLHFHFTGKSGKEHEVDIRDRRVARVVQRFLDLPGEELFQYVDDEGTRHSIEATHVNEYLHAVSGVDITAKDFRTWHGTVAATLALRDIGPAETQSEAKHNVTRAIEAAADHLGNTPAIARKSYVHPAIVEAYEEDRLLPIFEEALPEREGLTPDEVAVLTFIERLENESTTNVA
ncbi:MAG TPA: DNA topoisomerase IB [Chloroflexota bacterium]|nr:DNA topoisomerase IB [Chloroflexota bacterium]